MFNLDYMASLRIWNFKRLLSEKYDVVVTNPPYMGGKGQSGIVTEFLKDNFPDTKSDTFSAFIEQCGHLCKRHGYIGMFTPYVWMFIQSYEKLRKMVCYGKDIVTLIQFEYSAFEEATVPVCTFVLRNIKTSSSGEYLRLVDYRGGMEVQRLKTLEAISNPNCGYRYTATVNNFSKIPGMPISYWASENLIKAFEIGTRMDEIVNPKQGLATADNDRFLRYWWEVDINKIKFNAKSRDEAVESRRKWFPYNKGGPYRRWYGNYDYVVNWENDGHEIRNFTDDKGKQRSRPQNTDFYFQEAITWPLITSGGSSVRLRKHGSIHDVSGMSAFTSNKELMLYIIGLLNTKIGDLVLKILNPTLNSQVGDFQNIPVIIDNDKLSYSLGFISSSVYSAKDDWDNNEMSWDFERFHLT